MSADNDVITALERTLAGSIVLAANTQAAHWNVTGPQFASLHQMFGDQYEELQDAVDELAERIRALGSKVRTGLAHFQQTSSVSDIRSHSSASELLSQLVEGHLALQRELDAALRAAQMAGDEVSADMCIGRLTEHQKMVWMLRAHLE